MVREAGAAADREIDQAGADRIIGQGVGLRAVPRIGLRAALRIVPRAGQKAVPAAVPKALRRREQGGRLPVRAQEASPSQGAEGEGQGRGPEVDREGGPGPSPGKSFCRGFRLSLW